MKLFHIECFITDKHVYDTMSYLESVSARDLAVRTVKNSEPTKATDTKSHKIKHDWVWLIDAFREKPELDREDLTALYKHQGINPRGGISAAVRHRKLKKNAKGNYMRGPALKEAA